MGGLIGVLLGLSFIALFDYTVDFVSLIAGKLNARKKF